MTPVTASDPEFDLTAAFNAFAKRVVRDFPWLKGKFAIYSAATDTLYGSFDPASMPSLLETQRLIVQEEKDNMKGSIAFSDISRENGYYSEFFIGQAETWPSRHNYTTYDDPRVRELLGHMNHELGHLVAPGGYARGTHGPHFRENVADAFSFILQLQEYGTISAQIESNNHRTAVEALIYGRTVHFDLPTKQALDALSTTYDLNSLTPVKTANLAYRLSLLYAPREQEVQRLAEIFKPVKQAAADMGKNFSMAPFEECARIMFEEHGPDSRMVFEAGKALLEPYLNKREEIVRRSSEHFDDFAGEFWDDIRNKIKERAQQEEEKTPAQRLAQEAKDMMVLGRFDRKPDKIIDPAAYESKRNMAYLQRAQDAYTAIRCLQETGEQMPGRNTVSVENAAALNRDQIIALARKIAAGTAPSSLKRKTTPAL